MNRTREERIAQRKAKWGDPEEQEDLEDFLAELKANKAARPAKQKKLCPLCKKQIVPSSYEAHMEFHRSKGQIVPDAENDLIDPSFTAPRVLVLMGLPGEQMEPPGSVAVSRAVLQGLGRARLLRCWGEWGGD